VTITLPIHPLVGVRLALLRQVRSIDGKRRYVDAEHPCGWTIRLPMEWTDRAPSLLAPRIGDREVRLAAAGLLKLAAAVEVSLGQKLDRASASEQMVRYTDARPEKRPAPVVSAAGDGAARSARRMGRARPQDAPLTGRGRGGKR
jgi:hypothetical protein